MLKIKKFIEIRNKKMEDQNDDFIISDQNDLRTFLKIVLNEINRQKLSQVYYENELIDRICKSLMDTKDWISLFGRETEKWKQWFEPASSSLFDKIIECHKIYQKALVDCNDFDVMECLDENPDFESFFRYVLWIEKPRNQPRKQFENHINEAVGRHVKMDLTRLAHAVYRKSKQFNDNKVNVKFLKFNWFDVDKGSKVSNVLSGAVLASVGVGLTGNPIMLVPGFFGGYLFSSKIVKPYWTDYMA